MSANETPHVNFRLDSETIADLQLVASTLPQPLRPRGRRGSMADAVRKLAKDAATKIRKKMEKKA